MKTKLISIIIGSVLIVGTGTLVYTTKKPMLLPSEDITNSESTLNNNQTDQTQIQNQTPAKTTTPTTTVKKFWSDDDDDDEGGSVVPSPVVTPKPTTTTTTPATTPSGITLSTIAKHGTSSSCWSAVNGSVYDLTSWIPNHPGGEQAILSMCGVDGSNGYNGQHGGSLKPARILGGFKIGTLAK